MYSESCQVVQSGRVQDATLLTSEYVSFASDDHLRHVIVVL